MDNEILKLDHHQKTIRNRFLDEISKENEKIGYYLKEIFKICTNSNRETRIEVYKKVLNDLKFGSIEREKLIEYYAKIMDLERRVRKFFNAKIYNEKIEDPNSTATADRFEYVFFRMKNEDVPLNKVKEFFNENAYAIFSLTMHPTNPTSTDYTVNGGIQFDKYLDNDIDYEQHLKLLEHLPLVGPKKTVQQEVEETIAIIDIIYETSTKLRIELIESLKQIPSYENLIDVNRPLIQVSIWSAGDGDGNENADINALKQAVIQLKQRIKQLYLNDIKQLSSDKKMNIQNKLINNLYKTPNDLIHDLEDIPDAQDLIYKIKTFRFHYAQIDIRHNAFDIMETVDHLAKVNGLIENFSSLSLEDQKKYIIEWLNNDNIIEKLKLTDDDILDKNSKTAARIFGRLKLIKYDVDIYNKLIIAETSSIVHVLAAFLLLKASGNSIAEKETIIDIVTLSESVKDLEELPNLISELINDSIYRKHLFYREKLIVMIAKSDTVRRNGRGAESSQEHALGTIYSMLDQFKYKYPELKNLTINGFSGGGAALQRGGGRVTEVAHNNGRAARFYHAKTLGPSLLTIQGHQMQILFSPSSIALHILQSLVAQNLHARAQTELKSNGEHYVLPRRAPKDYDERKNIEKFHHACQVMRQAYFNYIGDLDDSKDKQSGNNSFNQLFLNAPWISVILGNLSSRPSKRGGHEEINQNITVRNLRGENPKLLDNRAITVERLTAHSGTHFLNYLSVYEGLKSINYDELNDMYICSKSCRDFMRNTALSLHMIDFDIAWFTLIGEVRPDKNELISLAKNFKSNRNEKNTNKETLAWLELYAYDVAKLVYKCILNKDPPENFNLHSPLRSGFSNLAQQLTIREESNEFARYAQADMTNFMNNNLDFLLGTHECLTLQACYAAADVVNAPEGGLNIELTRKQPT
ncbi:unnamed protein product [Rotaria sordida]|uniref:Phosphoenolpyruvate carboxylase n=1 Tax=Rotaria sordida TaxID=392033 RepID=A0A818ZUV9_9BILA|nr:unnamed protein product [Rotaria sordida]CAF3772768.1 unnamed protein product [Rotaria sordida]